MVPPCTPKQLRRHRSLPSPCQTSEPHFKFLSSTEVDPNPTNRYITTPKHHQMSNPPNKIHAQPCTVLKHSTKTTYYMSHVSTSPPLFKQTRFFFQSPFFIWLSKAHFFIEHVICLQDMKRYSAAPKTQTQKGWDISCGFAHPMVIPGFFRLMRLVWRK